MIIFINKPYKALMYNNYLIVPKKFHTLHETQKKVYNVTYKTKIYNININIDNFF